MCPVCPTLAIYATGGALLVVSWLTMYSMIKFMYEMVGQSELHVYLYPLCMYMVTVLLESIIYYYSSTQFQEYFK